MRLSVVGGLSIVAIVSLSCTTEEPAACACENDYRFEEVRIPLDEGISLYARVVGYGPDTVIVPAGMYLSQDYRPLAEGRTLIFYDMRSRGGSDVVADARQLGVEFDVADLEAVRAHFRVGRASLIGWSYLGAVVALYAAEYPEHVVRVVQVGPMAPRPLTPAEVDRRDAVPDSSGLHRLAILRQAGAPEKDPVGYCREWVRLVLLPYMTGRPQGVSNSSMDPCLYRNEWPDRLFETLSDVVPSAWDYSNEAARVEVPVLTVHGSADPSAPIEGGRDWVSLLPNARLLRLEGVGHVPHLESPDRFFSEVSAFLRGN